MHASTGNSGVPVSHMLVTHAPLVTCVCEHLRLGVVPDLQDNKNFHLSLHAIPILEILPLSSRRP